MEVPFSRTWSQGGIHVGVGAQGTQAGPRSERPDPHMERGEKSTRQPLEKSTWNKVKFPNTSNTRKEACGSHLRLLPEGASRAEHAGQGVWG